MNEKQKQLFLEVLLLSSRFSEKDFEAVRDAMRNFRQNDEIFAIMNMLFEIVPSKKDRRPSRTNELSPTGEETSNIASENNLKKHFLSYVKREKQFNSQKSISLLQKSLGIYDIADTREEALRRIEEKLENTPTIVLRKIMSKLKIKFEDSDYINLANYIMSKDNEGGDGK